MKRNVHAKSLLLIFWVLFCSFSIRAQNGIKGTVTDEKGLPVIGATIIVKGTNNGTVSDMEGKYSINAREGDEIMVSFIGYLTKEMTVSTGITILDVTLEPDMVGIDEIVVIGYGSQRKSDVTSAVASVKNEDFLAGNIQDAAELVKGKIAGLTITKGSGNPNEESVIRLRGIISLQDEQDFESPLKISPNTPLVLIDGIEGDMGTVAPENIKSIDVLKDASASAIYGTRGANGVIIITTYSGNLGQATNVKYSTYGTMSGFLKVADFMDEDDVAAGKTAFKHGGWDNNWLEVITQPGLTQNHNLNIIGGTEATSYSANASFRNERGTIKGTNNEELKLQMDLNQWLVNDKIKLNFNVIRGTHKNDVTRAGENGVSNVYRQAIIRNPSDPVYIDGDEELGYHEKFTVFQYYNPVAIINENIGENKREWTRLTGNVTLQPFHGWQTNLKLSTHLQNESTESYTTKKYYTAQTNGNNGFAFKRNRNYETNLLELTSRYDKTISRHRFSALGGYGYQYDLFKELSASNFDYPTDAYLFNNLGGGAALKDGEANMGSLKKDSKLISFFGRLTYSYDNKYNLMVSVRHEGSSLFGTNNKWATFPAVSAGWIVSNENFMNNLSWLNNLKLRAGYGITGMIASEPYRSITRWDYNTETWGYYLDSKGEWKPGLEIQNNPNPNLQWETSGELNIGTDFSFMNNRISGSIDYYDKRTKDLLYNYNVPSPPNFHTSTLANAGTMQNTGIEVLIKGVPVRRPEFEYNTTLTVTHNKNKLLDYSNELYETENYVDGGWAGDPISLPTQRIEVGGSFGRYYTLVTKGVSENGKWMVQNPETGKYEEFKADMTPADSPYRQWLGTTAIPKVYLGWGNTFKWKNFDLNIQMSSQLGFQIVNEQRSFYENNSIAYNKLETAADPIPIIDSNGVATGESTLLATSQPQTIVSWYFEDGDFLKLDFLTLGYKFNTTRMKFVDNFRVYISGENLFCLTKYSGLDPELSNSYIWGLGIDGRDKYPTIRSFTIGASINFK